MTPRFPICVRVTFDEYGGHVPYAADLSELLSVPLVVHAPVRPGIVERAAELLNRAPRELDSEIMYTLLAETQAHFRQPETANVTVALSGIPRGLADDASLVVSCATEHYPDRHVLSPAGEYKVFRTNKGPLLVPLGDGAASIRAARIGIALARTLETKVLFWHTTWKNPTEEGHEPRKHLAPMAETVVREAERLGHEAGVTDEECRIECAPTVVESIIRVALYSGASLIVMSRGRRKRFGAYPDRVRGRNCPVPLLVLGRMR